MDPPHLFIKEFTFHLLSTIIVTMTEIVLSLGHRFYLGNDLVYDDQNNDEALDRFTHQAVTKAEKQSPIQNCSVF